MMGNCLLLQLEILYQHCINVYVNPGFDVLAFQADQSAVRWMKCALLGQIQTNSARSVILFLECFTHLDGHTAPCAVVVHKDAQHVWDKLRQVELELSTKCHNNLLDQEDDGVLHGVVWCPVLLQRKTEDVNIH